MSNIANDLLVQPLVCSNMAEGGFDRDVLELRKSLTVKSDLVGPDGKAYTTTFHHHFVLRREDLPALLDALRQTFGELP